MNTSIHNPTHATAFPVSDDTASPSSDAPCANPAARVISKQAATLKNRSQLFISCWNVRTLLNPGSQSITMRSLYDYQSDITCLSETRLPNTGTRRIQVPSTNTSYWLYHSGPVDNSGLHGVALALSHRAKNALIAWNPVSPRLAIARFKGTPLNLTVLAVYAPTSTAEATVKNEFYEQLQAAVDRTPKRDILIVAGDWNARVGKANDNTRHILGPFGLGQRCENGDRLVNFAAFNQLVVSNTRFQHPNRHLLTWYSNNGHTAAQIDYILVRARWASSVQDCRSYRGAETGNAGGTDHTLVRCNFKLRFAARRKRCPLKRIDTRLLIRPETQRTLSEAITTRLDVACADHAHSHNHLSSVNDKWTTLKLSIQQATGDTLGYSQPQHKNWISENTMFLSRKATEARLNNQAEFRLIRRKATQSARKDRISYWSEMATTMEAAANVFNFAKLYRLIRTASGKIQPQQPLLRSSTGQFISDHDAKLQRWVDYFQQLLNHASTQIRDMPMEPNPIPYNSNCGEPSQLEIGNIINQLKNRKSPGEDGIPPEVYKYCSYALLEPLHDLFCSIWETETVPRDWGTSILLPLPKKGDKTICENYRGISLINVAAKLFASLLLQRFAKARDERVRPNQGGFRPGRGCVDQIFALRRTLEHRFKYQQPTTACFIDFRAAFDSVHRDSLWTILLADGVPLKLLNLIRAYYSSVKARVRVYGEETSEFNIVSGVRQGCPLSPVLFNFAIDWSLGRALEGYPGVQLSQQTWINDLEYADDIVLLGDNLDTMQNALDSLVHYAAQVGLQINTNKTKFFSTCMDVPTSPLNIGNDQIEQVSMFKYLGSNILPNGQAKKEILHRIDNARYAFMQLNTALWKRTEISLRTKIRVFNAAIRPVLIYACETWPLRVEDIRKLEVFDHWCLRRILKIRRLDKISNDEVRKRCFDLPRLSQLLQQRRLQWFGHLLRKNDTEISKQTLAPVPCRGWRCRLGGQLKTWLNTIKADVENLGLHKVYGNRHWNQHWVQICSELAADRRAWAAIVRDVSGADSS